MFIVIIRAVACGGGGGQGGIFPLWDFQFKKILLLKYSAYSLVDTLIVDIEQLLQTDDDMLNESDIAIKQGSHKKSVPKFCATRWTARVDTLSALIAKYKLILEALDQIQDTSNGDAKRDAGTYIRLLSDSKFLVSLVVAQFILSYCSCVTKTIQAVNCDLGKAYKDVHMSMEAIANARNETSWNKVWGRIESIAEAVDITITKPRTVSIQRHRSNAGHDQRLFYGKCVLPVHRPHCPRA